MSDSCLLESKSQRTQQWECRQMHPSWSKPSCEEMFNSGSWQGPALVDFSSTITAVSCQKTRVLLLVSSSIFIIFYYCWKVPSKHDSFTSLMVYIPLYCTLRLFPPVSQSCSHARQERCWGLCVLRSKAAVIVVFNVTCWHAVFGLL